MDSLVGVMPFLFFFTMLSAVFWKSAGCIVCSEACVSGWAVVGVRFCSLRAQGRMTAGQGRNILFVWLACGACKVYFLAICMLRRQHAVCWGMRGRSRTASEWEIVRVKIMRIPFVYLHVWPIRKTGLSANYTYWHKTISCLLCLM